MAHQLRVCVKGVLRLAGDEPLALMGHRFDESPARSRVFDPQPTTEASDAQVLSQAMPLPHDL